MIRRKKEYRLIDEVDLTDSYLDNGYVVTDKQVRKLAETSLTLFDWIFRRDKVVTKILVAHTELLCKYQDLPPKES